MSGSHPMIRLPKCSLALLDFLVLSEASVHTGGSVGLVELAGNHSICRTLYRPLDGESG